MDFSHNSRNPATHHEYSENNWKRKRTKSSHVFRSERKGNPVKKSSRNIPKESRGRKTDSSVTIENIFKRPSEIKSKKMTVSSDSRGKSVELSPPTKESTRKSSKSVKDRKRLHPRSALTLKETLAECREDIIRIRDPEKIRSALRGLNEYEDVKIPIPSDHDLLQQPFERVSTQKNNGGGSATKLMNLFSMSTQAVRMKRSQRRRRSTNQVAGPHSLPPWRIPDEVRDRMSLIGVSIVIHEIACYLSAVLAGLLLWHALVGIAWLPPKDTLTYNWVYTWLYQPLSTFSVVITSLGFLLRVNLNSAINLRKFLLFLIPTLILLGSFYGKKGVDLRDLERLESNSTTNTTIKADTQSSQHDDRILILILVSASALMALIISLYLHLHRHSFYLVQDYQRDPDEDLKE